MKALITGGSGLVGGYLTDYLISQQWDVVHLSSSKAYKKNSSHRTFLWNPSKMYLEKGALEGVDVIFNLAGATVSKRWTAEYRQLILESRLQTMDCLKEALRLEDHAVQAVISASAVGIYPSSKTELYSEKGPFANDFLGSVTQKWEKALDEIHKDLNIRTAALRIGIVLSPKGGVLGQIDSLFKWGLGSALGNGKQWMSWIHAEDLARLFVHVYHSKHQGPINAGGPKPETNKDFSIQLAKALKRPFWLPPVPGVVIKSIMGEMGTLALMSQKVDSETAKGLDFKYKFQSLASALTDLYSQSR
jgi:uncharacterized protein